jgi:tocopherol O-methyltransferase
LRRIPLLFQTINKSIENTRIFISTFFTMLMTTVPEYYRHTRFDYRVVWGRRSNLAVHFGYYDVQASRHHEALNNTNRVLADLAGVQPGERVLDAGCGLGSACFWLQQHRRAEVTGISIVPGQIADCHREWQRRGRPPGIHFETADYLATPFPDASFDVVWACESLCHSADKAAFYREAYRLLRPGGRLVMAEYLRCGRPLAPAQETLLAQWLRPWAIPDLDTEAEHHAYARAAGFQDMQWQDVTPQVRVSLRNLHELCGKWLGIGKVLHRLGLISRIRLNNVHASMRLYEALKAGAWVYGMGVGRVPDSPNPKNGG